MGLLPVPYIYAIVRNSMHDDKIVLKLTYLQMHLLEDRTNLVFCPHSNIVKSNARDNVMLLMAFVSTLCNILQLTHILLDMFLKNMANIVPKQKIMLF